MQTYCAFLRGVNVAGRTMKMAEVCEVFRQTGVSDVTSVLASGNVIFRAEQGQAELREMLEKAMTEHYESEVFMFVKNTDEVSAILTHVPYEEKAEQHIYSFICERGFETTLLDEFGKVTPNIGEDVAVVSGLFYWQCPKGVTLDTGFSKILGRKSMRDKFTSRNINTIAKIAAKMK